MASAEQRNIAFTLGSFLCGVVMASGRLEDIFVTMGLATEKQVEECRTEVAGSGKALHACLITRCSIAPADVAKAYAQYAGLEYKHSFLNTLIKYPRRWLIYRYLRRCH